VKLRREIMAAMPPPGSDEAEVIEGGSAEDVQEPEAWNQ
jgi:hypothetical protein